MNILRRAVMAIGSMTVIALVIALAAPRAAHGIVATLVQVVNTTANPVPVVEPPTTVIFSGPLGGSLTLDVSAYRQIRVSFATGSSVRGFVDISNVDGSVPISIANLNSTTFGTTVIEIPGRMISLTGFKVDGTTLASVVVDGR